MVFYLFLAREIFFSPISVFSILQLPIRDTCVEGSCQIEKTEIVGNIISRVKNKYKTTKTKNKSSVNYSCTCISCTRIFRVGD